MYSFDAVDIKNRCVAWIQDFFKNNGPDCNAVVGISGGKDSSVVAALCVEALGKDRVIGVLMPNGEQHDIDMARKLVNHLGIEYFNALPTNSFPNHNRPVEELAWRMPSPSLR